MRNIGFRELIRLHKAAVEAKDTDREREEIRRHVEKAKKFREKLEATGVSYQEFMALEEEAEKLSDISRRVLVALERGEGIPEV